jgi:hypothetical protein
MISCPHFSRDPHVVRPTSIPEPNSLEEDKGVGDHEAEKHHLAMVMNHGDTMVRALLATNCRVGW